MSAPGEPAAPPPGRPEQPGTGEPLDLLLTGGTVVTVDDDRRVVPEGAVGIRGGRIVAVGPAAELAGAGPRARRVVDTSGCAVLPGLIDAHTHQFQRLTRGLGEGLEIKTWLASFMWPAAMALDETDARIAAEAMVAQAARNGVTCVLDHQYAPRSVAATLAVADALDRIGLRGVVARGLVGPATSGSREQGLPEAFFGWSVDEELDALESCLRARPAGGRVEVWAGPLNLSYVEPELQARAAALARDRGAGWHTHCAESPLDPGLVRAWTGKGCVELLDDLGALGPHATLAHCLWLDGDELAELRARGAHVVHNPLSNAFMGSGTLEVAALGPRPRLALGSDGPAVGHRCDPFDVMRQAAYLQRARNLDPVSLTSEQVLVAATRGGAAACGTDAGVLAAGRPADVIVVDLRGADLAPVHRVVETLVFGARGGDVRLTVVDGRIVAEDGRCTQVDEAEVLVRLRERAAALARRAGLTHLGVAWR